MSRLSSSVAHSAPMPYPEPQSLTQPQTQYPNGLGYPQYQYYQPSVYYQDPATYYEPQQFYQQAEGHYPQMSMPSACRQPEYYQPPQQYPPQVQFRSACTTYPQQQHVQAYPSNYTQPAPISQFRPIRPKPTTPQVFIPPLPNAMNRPHLALPPPNLILNSEPRLNALIQPFTKRGRPKRPQKVRPGAQPSKKLLPLEPQALQSVPNPVKLGTFPAGTENLSIANNASNPIQSRPPAQVSQLALPMPGARPEVPAPSYPVFALPRSSLPSQLPRINHHEYLSQPTAALSHGYSCPGLQCSSDLSHLNQPLTKASPKELTASEARSILNVSDFAMPADIRAAYWSLEFELHPDRHRDHLPGVQYVKAVKLAKAQEAADTLGGFTGTCWESERVLERDFEAFKRMSDDAGG
ncbi:hypothetical protein N7G274_009753 [Stereocaulon virgatum]|uniref:J domain-containing protein n=1 Tax=Stereocaulon virgatum TaxID=373712 RepID=A0ABR3ZZG0_9LECA